MCSSELPILPRVFRFFASDPIGPMLTLPRIAGDPQHPLVDDLKDQLESIPSTDVGYALQDASFRAFGRHFDDDVGKAARIWLLLRALHKSIPRTRLSMLSSDHRLQQPVPYANPALAGVDVSEDDLVPLSAFSMSGSRLARNGYAFSMVSPLQSPNSQYWILQAICQLGLVNQTSVRLDPLLHRSADDFPAMGYRMWWYGRELDWIRIASLRVEDHGRWLPGPLSTKAQFIDYVWTPRNDGIHFRCEEIPTAEEVQERGSRYVHAIYSPASSCVTHLDGSIRIYTEEELAERTHSHVRSSGKVGKRIKTFRISGQLDRQALADICIGYFVWSFDVARYFGVAVPEQL